MKAWRVSAHGGVDRLERVEMPRPEPGPLQVRVRVEAVGLNHLDLWVRKGVEGHRFPLPMTPGCDFSGSIDAFGPGAEAAAPEFKNGSPVIVDPIVCCGRCEACLSGQESLCREFGIYGETEDGACSDFICVPVSALISRPPNLSAVQAASIGVPFVTAWSMLVDKAKIRPGDLVLIHAGGSSVSIAAIQIAKLLGATVVTTVGDDWKAPKCEALGADHVFNYKKVNFRAEVKKLLPKYAKLGCDIVMDHVGETTFSDSLKSLVWGGKLVVCGATSGAKVNVDLKAVFFKNLSILGSTMGSRADLLRIVGLIAQGKLRTVVDSTFPMAELPQAHAKLEGRQVFGKVAVTA